MQQAHNVNNTWKTQGLIVLKKCMQITQAF